MENAVRILFVEDDPDMLGIYTENFSTPEFECNGVSNGAQALELLKNTDLKYDVVVTDNYMPQMDGLTLLRRIRETHPSLKVIIVTGYGDWEQYVDAHNLGVTRFIDKPVRMADLKELIRALIKAA